MKDLCSTVGGENHKKKQNENAIHRSMSACHSRSLKDRLRVREVGFGVINRQEAPLVAAIKLCRR